MQRETRLRGPTLESMGAAYLMSLSICFLPWGCADPKPHSNLREEVGEWGHLETVQGATAEDSEPFGAMRCSLRKAEFDLDMAYPPCIMGRGPRALEAMELCSGLLSTHLIQGGSGLGLQGTCSLFLGSVGSLQLGR